MSKFSVGISGRLDREVDAVALVLGALELQERHAMVYMINMIKPFLWPLQINT